VKKSSLRYPLLTFVMVAAAGCGGSESSNTGGTGDNFAFDASAYKQKPGSDPTGGGGGGGGGGGVVDPSQTPPGPNCGDGTVNADEQCDGPNLSGKTCATMTMGVSPNGTLVCRANCTLDVSGCTGNGPPGGGSTGGGSNGAGGGRGQGTGAGPNTGAGGGP